MNRIGRWIAAGALALAAGGLAQHAHAQVAAPALTPGTANIVVGNTGFDASPSFAPVNPSVMSWNGSSVFGLGETKVNRDAQGPPKQSEEYGGSYGGFRWTGEKLAIGLQTLNLSSDKSNVNLTYKDTDGAVSGKLAEWFSLGGGYEKTDVTGSGYKQAYNYWRVGGSAKVGDVFYAGVNTGQQHIENKQTGNNYSDDRAVSAYGLGGYNGGGKGGAGAGGFLWHLEYNVVNADDFTDSNGTKFGGFSRTTGVVEINWKSILVSYSGYSNKAKTGKGTLDGSAIEAGWAPEKSFFVTARVQNNTEKKGSAKVADSNSMSVNVGIQF